jgi:hypothetical protein
MQSDAEVLMNEAMIMAIGLAVLSVASGMLGLGADQAGGRNAEDADSRA